jgi:hypothetical protein
VTRTRNGVVAMLWPVVRFTYAEGRRQVAWFFDYGDAVSFVNAGGNSLYIGEPVYDHLERETLCEVHGDPLLRRVA